MVHDLGLVKTIKPTGHVCMCAKSLSCVWLFATPWTVPCQAPLSMEFSREETRVGCHFLLQGIFPTRYFTPSPTLAGGSINREIQTHWEPLSAWCFLPDTAPSFKWSLHRSNVKPNALILTSVQVLGLVQTLHQRPWGYDTTQKKHKVHLLCGPR